MRSARSFRRLLRAAITVGACAFFGQHRLAAQALTGAPTDVIRASDSVAIAVSGQSALTGQYEVSPEGTVRIPIVGSVPAANLTAKGFAELLKTRLDAYVKNPNVQVTLVRKSIVFALGEVKTPGPFPLTDGLTVVGLLTQAGYTGSGEVLLVRSPGAVGPVLPDNAAPSSVIRVNLRELEKAAETGDLSRNLVLKPSDTVFVPKVDPTLVYVVGKVKKPGAYSVADGTTVLQAVTLAGGPTDDGHINGARLGRWTEGGRGRHVRLTEPVHPGDSISVPEVFRIPSIISVPSSDGDRPRVTPFRILLGSNVALTPAFAVSRVGADTNVFAGSNHLEAVPTATFGPTLGMEWRSGPLDLNMSGRVGFAAFPTQATNNSVDPGYGIAPRLTLTQRLLLHGQYDVNYAHDHWNTDIDLIARRREVTEAVGFTVRPFSRVSLVGDARDWRVTFDPNQVLYGVDLQQTQTEHIRSVKGTIQVKLTGQSSLSLSAGAASHRFPLFHDRDANASELSIGMSFEPTAAIKGSVKVSWLQYFPLDPTVDVFEGPAGSVSLSRSIGDRTEIGVLAERTTGTSLGPQFAFAMIDRGGVWLQRVLSRRLDVVGQAFGERFRNRSFHRIAPELGVQWADTRAVRYTGSLGVRVGAARIGANVSVSERVQPLAYQSLLFWADVSYGVFQVRNR